MSIYLKNTVQEPFLLHLLKDLFYTLIFAVIIAFFFWLIVERPFLDSLIISVCIGFLVCLFIMSGIRVLKPANRVSMFFIVIVGIFFGTCLGFILSFRIIGLDLSLFLESRYILQTLVVSLLIALVITYFFFSMGIIANKEARIREERINRLNLEKKAAEANLRLLQAQIEPHFLFNTLSNILSLLDTDLDKGKSMLIDLMHYLRTTLSKTRDDITTIGGEMEIIRTYLNIFKIRMGDRLRFQIDIPDDVKEVSFQPMLIQPLVENAIKHGLEPEINGGEIHIRGETDGGILRIEVTDSGAGLYENSNPGIGIDNIKERLKSIYGDKGRLILRENKPSGLRAIIEVPYEPDQGNNCG